MKKAAFVLLLIFIAAPVLRTSAENLLNTDDILSHLDREKYSKAQVREYYEAVRGKEAEGSGTVVNVLSERGGKYRVTILSGMTAPEKGYNMVLYVASEKMPSLEKGQKVKIRGTVGRLSPFRGTSIDIIGTYEAIKE